MKQFNMFVCKLVKLIPGIVKDPINIGPRKVSHMGQKNEGAVTNLQLQLNDVEKSGESS